MSHFQELFEWFAGAASDDLINEEASDLIALNGSPVEQARQKNIPPPMNPFPDDDAFDTEMERLTRQRNRIKGVSAEDQKEAARKPAALDRGPGESRG